MARAPSTISPATFSTFGELLRYLRRRQRMTQIELAIAVGYSTAQISRLEQNLRQPNPSTLQALLIPALGLEDQPDWATRLLELARTTRDDEYADTALPEQAPTDAPHSTGQEPDTAQPQHSAFDVADGAHILLTKLYLPRPRPGLVERPRLISRLDAALHVPLTMVVAPAGFGKTTLLASWLASVRLAAGDWRLGEAPQASSLQLPASSVAWLALDDGDNDPIAFLRYLIAAFQTITPEIGRSALALLKTSQPPAPEALLRIVLNDLTRLTYECLLILDDYHLISASAVHQMMVYLVEHLPPPLHLLIASREDPPLPLARLRARGQLAELRASELRFSHEEAATFLIDGMQLALTGVEVAALETRTEGWIAGLQLAALAMQQRADVQGFISAFTGSNRFVVDYLAAEVFERQPPHLQTFLLQTSILERLCGPLCDAVMGVEHDTPRAAYTQSVLEDLERANLFLVPLDDERRWYRYHHLFGEVLRERLLRGAKAEDVEMLHRRASAWYEGQGLMAEAIQHALAAQDWPQAARLIEEQGFLSMLRGHAQTVLGWLSALPADFVQTRPLLCIILAVELIGTNQNEAAEARLRDAEHALTPEMPDELVRVAQGTVTVLRSSRPYFIGDLALALGLAQQALAQLPATASHVATRITSAIASAAAQNNAVTISFQLTGDVTDASERKLIDTNGLVRASGNLTTALFGYTSLAHLQKLQGRLRAAAATYVEFEQLVPSQDALRAIVSRSAYYIGIGDLRREWNDLDAARGELARAMELLQGAAPAIEAGTILRGYVAFARVQQAQGQGTAALATLRAFMQLARERKLFHLIVDQAMAMEARLHLMQGDLAAAVRWADASGLTSDDPVEFSREAGHLTLARVRIAQGRVTDILPLLDRLLADAEAKARMHSAIEILIVQALAVASLGDRSAALAVLQRALALAEPEGYVRTFVDEGQPLAELLRAGCSLPARSSFRPYITTLLATFPQADAAHGARDVPPSPQHSKHNTQNSLIEPLSEREREVLRLLAAGRSNSEIARELIIAVGTVKRHIHSIFGKLGAANRLEAVNHARDLGLLA